MADMTILRRFTWTCSSQDAQPIVSPHRWWALTPPSHPYLPRIRQSENENYTGTVCRHSACGKKTGGYFLLHYSTLTDSFYIRKWDALCCPDFPLSSTAVDASDRPSGCFHVAKLRIYCWISIFFIRLLSFSFLFCISLLFGYMLYWCHSKYMPISVFSHWKCTVATFECVFLWLCSESFIVYSFWGLLELNMAVSQQIFSCSFSIDSSICKIIIQTR